MKILASKRGGSANYEPGAQPQSRKNHTPEPQAQSPPAPADDFDVYKLFN